VVNLTNSLLICVEHWTSFQTGRCQVAVFLAVMPYSNVGGHLYFVGPYCLQFEGEVSAASKEYNTILHPEDEGSKAH
jgi:hypothetical protein